MSSDKSFETEVKKLSKYADAKLDRVFKQMLSELFKSTPDDPIQYMIDFLTKYKRNQVEAEKKKPEQKKNGLTNYADSVIVTDEENESTELEDSGDVVHELPKLVIPEKPKIGGRRRTGVSAEPSGAQMIDDAPTRVIPKTEEDKKSILEAVKNNFLFSSLDKDQMKIVLDAMQQRRVKTGDTIIKQGEDGEDFFVLEDGECHCFLNQADGAPPKMVKVYKKGESFGELALMYNCPRMASIKAMTDGKLWAMDRITFRKVLMNTTSQKRQRYERFLSNVPLLVGLHKYERAKIADALLDKGYQDKEFIIRAGDTKDQSFYILEEGVCIATKPISVNDVKDAQLMEVARYKPGDYFGELALITDQPRAANIVSVGECRCVSLDRDSFTRLLGPCEEILKRKTGDYLKTDERLRHERRRTMGNAADLTMSSPTNSTSSKKNGR